MKAHNAARMLVDAEKDLLMAQEVTSSALAIDHIRSAYDKIMKVGDGLWPRIIKEIRKEKTDPMM